MRFCCSQIEEQRSFAVLADLLKVDRRIWPDTVLVAEERARYSNGASAWVSLDRECMRSLWIFCADADPASPDIKQKPYRLGLAQHLKGLRVDPKSPLDA